jgi:hypothetical protein
MRPLRPTELSGFSTSGAAAIDSGIAYADPALWKQLGEASSFRAYCDIWLSLQSALIGNITGSGVFAGPEMSATSLAVQPAGWDPAPLSKTISVAAEQRRGVAQYGASDLAGATLPGLAFPILVRDELHGIAAFEMRGASEVQLRTAMRQLQWGVAGLREYILRQDKHAHSDKSRKAHGALDMLSVVLEQERFGGACRSLATELAGRFGCERVSIGFVRRGYSEIVAISHSAQFGQQMNLVRLIGIAMDEAIDQRAIILHPPAMDEMNVTRAHAELASSCAAGAILTIPLFVRDRFIGAVSLERGADDGFDPDSIAVLDGIAAITGPILEEKRRNDRWIVLKAWDAFAIQIRTLAGPGHAARKLIILCIVVLAAAGYFWTGMYRVAAEAVVEGQIQRSVVAPFNGFVLEASARAGDTVHTGQLIARLDDRDLILERLKWVTERQRKVLEFEKAMGERNRTEQKISATQIEQADAQIHLVDEQLSRARLTAPFNGQIISGDLTQSIGGSLQRGQELFQIAPLDSYRVVLEVDETQIAEIALSQKGRLVVSSLPGDSFDGVVSKITPVSRAHDGRNTFKIEAELAEAPAALRPGMRGIAKIDVDRRRMAWIVTRSFLEWLRITAWRWIG